MTLKTTDAPRFFEFPKIKRINDNPIRWHYNLPNLTISEKGALLELARESIAAYLQTGEITALLIENPMLTRCAGAFVTLWTYEPLPHHSTDDSDVHETFVSALPTVPRPQKRLRGCIGHIWPDTPLYQVVQEMAVAAATRDPRLPPVTLEELDHIHLEISLLSPLYTITKKEQIDVGLHGLLITQGKQRSLLLPEVPIERGWSREVFLAALCRKAGLPRDCWPGQALLYAFTTLKFGE